MKIKLVFPPPANPSYVPLGVASLVSYAEQRSVEAEVESLDLNLAAWRYLTRDADGAKAFWDFMSGVSGDFFDSPSYSAQFCEWERASAVLNRLHEEVRTYLETGECGSFAADFLGEMAKTVLAGSPSMVGFSVLFPDQLAFAAAVAKWLREIEKTSVSRQSQETKIFFGGAMMTAIDVPELLSGCPFIDGVVAGEGELPFFLLAQGHRPESIPGLWLVKNGCARKPPEGIPVLMENIPAPGFRRFSLKQYANPAPVVPVTLSRSCKWNRCRFCAHNFSFSIYREKNVGMFVEELNGLIEELGVRHFYFADQYVPPATLDALSGEILARGLKLHFHIMGRPTEKYTANLLNKASEAGCTWISWGVESGSQRLLNLIRKGTTSNGIRRVMENSSKAGISNLAMMIFGLPTSGEEDLEETFRLIDDIYPYTTAFTASSFALFQNTCFANNADRFGLRVVKREELFRSNGTAVHSGRLQYMQKSSDDQDAPPSGPVEIARWLTRRQWLGDIPFEEKLCCEHFLLHAARKEVSPRFNPIVPAPPKAA